MRVTYIAVITRASMYCTVDKGHNGGGSSTQAKSVKDGEFAFVYLRSGPQIVPRRARRRKRNETAEFGRRLVLTGFPVSGVKGKVVAPHRTNFLNNHTFVIY